MKPKSLKFVTICTCNAKVGKRSKFSGQKKKFQMILQIILGQIGVSTNNIMYEFGISFQASQQLYWFHSQLFNLPFSYIYKLTSKYVYIFFQDSRKFRLKERNHRPWCHVPNRTNSHQESNSSFRLVISHNLTFLLRSGSVELNFGCQARFRFCFYVRSLHKGL